MPRDRTGVTSQTEAQRLLRVLGAGFGVAVVIGGTIDALLAIYALIVVIAAVLAVNALLAVGFVADDPTSGAYALAALAISYPLYRLSRRSRLPAVAAPTAS